MVVRDREVGDLAGREPDLGQLTLQRPGDEHEVRSRTRIRPAAERCLVERAAHGAIGQAGVEQQRAARMHDQIARHRHVGVVHLLPREVVGLRVVVDEGSAIEDVEPQGRRSLLCLRRLHRIRQRCPRKRRQRHRQDASESQSGNRHVLLHVTARRPEDSRRPAPLQPSAR